MASASEPDRLDRLPPFAWVVIAVAGLAVLYTILQVVLVRPYLWPAGAGATLAGDPTTHLPLRARPPDVAKDFTSPPEIVRVAEGSPADVSGFVAGDRLRAQRSTDDPRRNVTFDEEIDDEQTDALSALGQRAAMALDDRRIQQQLFSSLEALTPEVEMIQSLRAAARYEGGR